MWEYKYHAGKEESEFNIMSADIISKHCRNIDFTLELGCGTGQLTKLVFDHHISSLVMAVLIDSSDSARQYVKEYFKQNSILSSHYEFIYGDILSLLKMKHGVTPFHRRFDIVFSSGLIEHFVGKDLKELIEIHKGTTQKYIACIVPNATEKNIKSSQTEGHIKKYGYERPMTEKELDALFVDDKFKKIHSERFYKNEKLLIGIYSK